MTVGILLVSISIFAVGVAIFGTYLALKKFGDKKRSRKDYSKFPVTILKPLKGTDEGLEANLESFFEIDYPNFELIFSIADYYDPAHEVVKKLCKKYQNINAKIIVGIVNVGTNPKINNLISAEGQASNDLILISDSNIRVGPEYLYRVVDEYGPNVGIVTGVVAGTHPSGMGGQLDALFLNTFYARGMNLANWSNKPCVIGKSMFYSKKTAKRFGGLKVLGNYLHEDQMAGEAMAKLGLKIVLMSEKVPQYIGYTSLKSFWDRHIRWGRIRKNHTPVFFLLELLQNSVFAGLVGALGAYLLGIPFMTFFGTYLLLWMCADILLYLALNDFRLPVLFPIHWMIRESLTIPMHIQVLWGNHVHWRGQKLTLEVGGLVQHQTKS